MKTFKFCFEKCVVQTVLKFQDNKQDIKSCFMNCVNIPKFQSSANRSKIFAIGSDFTPEMRLTLPNEYVLKFQVIMCNFENFELYFFRP